MFVVGSGPQLNELSAAQIQALQQRVTIGLNRVPYLVGLRYFISAYPAEVMLAQVRMNSGTVIHFRPRYRPPIVDGTLALKRRVYEPGEDLPRRLGADEPTLLTRKNVALGATHLALVLGARRVVYIGVEQRSAAHFYDVRPELRAQMKQDLQRLDRRELFTVDHKYATYESMIERLERDPEELRTAPFFTYEHTDTFRMYFEQLRAYGIEPVATSADCVVAEAGASIEALDAVLGA